MPSLLFEIEHGRNSGKIIAGTDEAGRGPLAGPVVAAAVIIPEHFPADLADAINDSKKISEKKRDALFPRILETCIHGIAQCSAQEIDEINILQASLLAMKRSVALLSAQPYIVLVDGNKSPLIAPIRAIPIIKGDSKSLSIAAASILAKVTRDRLMQQLHEEFPHYGWAHNAGYPTKDHVEALTTHGITTHHRRSFGPVKRACER